MKVHNLFLRDLYYRVLKWKLSKVGLKKSELNDLLEIEKEQNQKMTIDIITRLI